MIKFFMTNSRRLTLYITLIIGIIVCFFSQGFHHPDEHYSTIELMNTFKTGVAHPQFGWDVLLQIRSTIQPALYFLIEKIMSLLFVENPFIKSFYFRLFSFSLSTFGLYLFYHSRDFFQNIKNEEESNSVFIFTLLCWFVPYYFARTSSENMSIGFFFLAASLVFRPKFLILSGFLFAMSFATRFQMAIPIGMTFLWLLYQNKNKFWKMGLNLIIGLTIGLLVMYLVDSYLYHGWTFTPWNYFRENILKSRVNEFGVHPWYFYLTKSIEKGAGPIGLVLLFTYFFYLFKNPKSYLIWITTPFWLIHNLIGHKEVRFLQFIYILTPLMLFELRQYWFPYLKNIFVRRLFIPLLLIVNCLFLVQVLLSPAYKPIKAYQFLYKNVESKEIFTPLWENHPPLNLMMKYYVKDNLQLIPKDLNQLLEVKNEPLRILTSTYYEYSLFLKKGCSLDYSTYPQWILEFNPFSFRDRSSLWAYWECNISK